MSFLVSETWKKYLSVWWKCGKYSNLRITSAFYFNKVVKQGSKLFLFSVMHNAVPFCWSFLNQKPSCVLIYLYYTYTHFLLCRQTNSFADLIVHLFVVALSLSISWVTQYKIICLLSPPARVFSSVRCFVFSTRLTIQSSVVFKASLQRKQPLLPRTSFSATEYVLGKTCAGYLSTRCCLKAVYILEVVLYMGFELVEIFCGHLLQVEGQSCCPSGKVGNWISLGKTWTAFFLDKTNLRKCQVSPLYHRGGKKEQLIKTELYCLFCIWWLYCWWWWFLQI